jgi:hypothetical protein
MLLIQPMENGQLNGQLNGTAPMDAHNTSSSSSTDESMASGGDSLHTATEELAENGAPSKSDMCWDGVVKWGTKMNGTLIPLILIFLLFQNRLLQSHRRKLACKEYPTPWSSTISLRIPCPISHLKRLANEVNTSSVF